MAGKKIRGRQNRFPSKKPKIRISKKWNWKGKIPKMGDFDKFRKEIVKNSKKCVFFRKIFYSNFTGFAYFSHSEFPK